MTSVLTVGGTTLPDNEVNLAHIDKLNHLSQRGKRELTTITWYLVGQVYDTGSSLISTMQARETLFTSDYQNATFAIDGTTAHELDGGDPNCVTGIRVLRTSFPSGTAEELATQRTYGVTLRATFASCESDLLYWSERLRFIGNCGPRFDVVETFYGPYSYLTAISTAQRVIQYGRAVGFSGYQLPPGSLFPFAEHQDRRMVELTSGENQGVAAIHYTTAWEYHHTSGAPLDTFPTTR